MNQDILLLFKKIVGSEGKHALEGRLDYSRGVSEANLRRQPAVSKRKAGIKANIKIAAG
jgi:hypothetical protein